MISTKVLHVHHIITYRAPSLSIVHSVSALATDETEQIHKETKETFQQGFSKVVYLDKIEEKLGSSEWQHLKRSPIAMIGHNIQK